MAYRTLVTLSACAFAGLALVGFSRSFRRKHLDFDFELDRLFI